jgi:hypothetical protein
MAVMGVIAKIRKVLEFCKGSFVVVGMLVIGVVDDENKKQMDGRE